MKHLFGSILLVVLLVGGGVVQAQSTGFFHTRGRDIIGPDGKPFMLKGTNLGNWLVPEGYMFKFKNTNSPRLINQALLELVGPEEAAAFWKKYLQTYITEADIHFLKSIGVNSLRLPFNYRLFTGEEYLGAHDAGRGFRLIDSLIGWCKKEGIYVILDMHCAPGGQTGDNIDDGYGYPFLFESESARRETIGIWTQIAKRYKNEKTIIGYDLLNEPVAHYFKADQLNPLVEPFYKLLATAIRSADRHHILFLGGAQWNTNFKIFSAPFDANVVYTFHKYGDQPNLGSIKRFIEFREKYNVPIYAGETGENTDEWVAAFRQLLDEQGIGWHFWPYKKMDSPRNIVSIPVPAGYDSLVNYVEAPRNTFKEIRQLAPANRQAIRSILDEFLNNCSYTNCTPNSGYIKALGFQF